MEWHDRLAWAQAMSSFEYEDNTLYSREQEEAIRHFTLVVENVSNDKIRASSIAGIVQYLSFRGRKDEAETYANLYPENYSVSKDEVLLYCLEGEKRIVHYQKMLDRAMLELLNLVGDDSDTACDAQESILHIMIPDGNYLYYHILLKEIYRKRTIFRMKEADYDNALKMLKQAFYHAREYDLFIRGKTTAKSLPFFDKLQCNVEEICKTGTTTEIEDMLKFLDRPLFDPVRERDDIKVLIKEFCRP